MILIGLTGPIACGKTTVLELVKKLGAWTIDADAMVHRLMAPGEAVWEAIVGSFGDDILRGDDTIDRRRLGQIVFRDERAMRRLERIVHPAIGEAIERELAVLRQEEKQRGEPVIVVLEAIKLIEAGYHKRCQSVWIVICEPERQIERLVRTRNLSVKDAEARLRSQPGWDEKMAYADVVIRNNGSRQHLESQVETAWLETVGRR